LRPIGSRRRGSLVPVADGALGIVTAPYLLHLVDAQTIQITSRSGAMRTAALARVRRKACRHKPGGRRG
jgi:hypothetical protein